MPYAFVLGLDVTPKAATLSILEETRDRDTDEPVYYVRRLERLVDEPSDEALASHVQEVIAQPPYTGRTSLVINQTSSRGQKVLDRLKTSGASPTGVLITEMEIETEEEDTLLASESRLVEAARALSEKGRLRLSKVETEASSWLEQGLAFYPPRTQQEDAFTSASGAGHQWRAARTGCVLATALACWVAEHRITQPATGLA